ncbi:hypothetical protein [Neobacillus cucumis]|uniref:hypothetical protein n=1 Tax=Neobacillus cucumis TaxID=1740721 RepID=UPI00196367A3|nr:hypothetical protein [Neobacillus cucumis]MBM7655830.1 uncharacterized membrane protein YcaP (DUF421 family) [Neobacillus cucumis]
MGIKRWNGYFIKLLTIRAGGPKTISELKAVGIVITFMLENIISHPLSDQTIGMK